MTTRSKEFERKDNKNEHTYVASLNRPDVGRFHYPWCKWADEINPDNLVEFSSHEEAAVSYKPCQTCRA